MSLGEMLDDLRLGWHVVIASDPSAAWRVTITAKRGGSSFTYLGGNLTRLVRSAWAGERPTATA